MTILNKIGLLLFIALSILMIYLMIIFNQQTQATEIPENDLIKYEYIITEVSSEGYIGDSVTDDTGIFFTQDNLQPDQIINEGDRIYAFFKKGSFDRLEKILLIKNE